MHAAATQPTQRVMWLGIPTDRSPREVANLRQHRCCKRGEVVSVVQYESSAQEKKELIVGREPASCECFGSLANHELPVRERSGSRLWAVKEVSHGYESKPKEPPDGDGPQKRCWNYRT